MNQTEPAQTNRTLRKRIRNQRQRLSASGLKHAERQLKKRLWHYPPLLSARRVASYLPSDGEIPPGLLERALPKATIFYPRITCFARREMRFYQALNTPQQNALGIFEPKAIGEPMPIRCFDAILLPLVAFDRTGNRLGMGAGFYDRALSFRLSDKSYRRPRLIGLAHHFQEVKSLTAQSWDVPLDAILTDVELITL